MLADAMEAARRATEQFIEALPKLIDEVYEEERQKEWKRREQETFGLDVVN